MFIKLTRYLYGLDIHRLGRTARAGNEGEGILVLADWEKYFLRKKDVVAAGLHQRIAPHPDTQLYNATGNNAPLNDMRARVRDALAKTDERSKEQAYIVSFNYSPLVIDSFKRLSGLDRVLQRFST